MKAMILAAGKGTRLGELTRDVPKPLMPLGDGAKIIDVTVDRLRRAGIVEIAVNLHHLGHMVRSHLETRFPDINWAFFPEEILLNTGGGIFNARSFLSDSEHFVVSNSDILHYIPITDVVRAHIESGARATMVLKPSGPARAVAYCPERGVLGFTNPGGELYYGRAEPKPPILYGTFCGVQVLHRSIFDGMAGEIFSIIDTYDALIGAGERVNFFDAGDLYWSDLGTPEDLETGRRVHRASLAADELLGGPPVRLRSVFEGADNKEVLRAERGRRSVIAVTSPVDAELDKLARRAVFLGGHGVPVPAVLTRRDGVVMTEDGGRQLLHALSGDDGSSKDLDSQAVDILVALSKAPIDRFLTLEGKDARAFDRNNVLFDIRYFNRHVMGAEADPAHPGWCGYHGDPIPDRACGQAADLAWSWFEGQPTALMHRDFQSTNLVVDQKRTLRVVDLSTLRTGYSVYDLASLAFDIYLPHDEERFTSLVGTFFGRFPELDRTTFWGAAWLRLLQATAAAFRFRVENPFFAASIPHCIEKLQRVMSEPAAAGLLAELPQEVTDAVNTLLISRKQGDPQNSG